MPTPPSTRSIKISDDERGGWSSDRPRRDGAGGVSLKLIKLGGITAALEAGKLCQRLGLSVNILRDYLWICGCKLKSSWTQLKALDRGG